MAIGASSFIRTEIVVEEIPFYGAGSSLPRCSKAKSESLHLHRKLVAGSKLQVASRLRGKTWNLEHVTCNFLK